MAEFVIGRELPGNAYLGVGKTQGTRTRVPWASVCCSMQSCTPSFRCQNPRCSYPGDCRCCGRIP